MAKINVLGTFYSTYKINAPGAFIERFKRPNDVALIDCDKKVIYFDMTRIRSRRDFFRLLKHELIHAYMWESGLYGYVGDETVVNWFTHHMENILDCAYEHESEVFYDADGL